MGKFAAEISKGRKVNTVEDLFIVCYFYYPLSTRWQWEDVLDRVLMEAVSENSITEEQSRQIYLAVMDCYFDFLD